MGTERKLKILYAGSPLASAMVLGRLTEDGAHAGYEICAVLTNPPSARGRHKELVPTDVAARAAALGIPVLAFDHLRAEAREAVAPLGADILVSFDYGRIFGEKFLALFPLGGINLHPGALPRYRGCTPVPAAILNGDAEIDVCVQTLALATDEGDLLARARIALTGAETTQSLMNGDGTQSPVAAAGAELLQNVLRAAAASGADGGTFSLPPAVPQAGEAGYTPLIRKEDGRIDWSDSAERIERKIRAYTPWPGCVTARGGVALKILAAHVLAPGAGAESSGRAGEVLGAGAKNDAGAAGIHIQCGRGILAATELQWEKKKAADWKSFLNGSRDFIGSILE